MHCWKVEKLPTKAYLFRTFSKTWMNKTKQTKWTYKVDTVDQFVHHFDRKLFEKWHTKKIETPGN